MKKSLKKALYLGCRKVKKFDWNNYRILMQKESILLKYWDWEKNWGDSVNPILLSKILGRNVISSNSVFNITNKKELLGVGSIISGDLRNKVIWGSGVISAQTQLFTKPHKVLALRGRLSLGKLAHLGINCEIFGDPVLLFPEVFPCVKPVKKYKYGIVPHFKERNSPLIQQLTDLQDSSILIIDPCSDILEFSNEVLSCEHIISSSLHGLILAESYGIPTLRYITGSSIIGGDFKYEDYYSGVGISTHDKIIFEGNSADFIKRFKMASQKDLKFSNKQLKDCLLNYYA